MRINAIAIIFLMATIFRSYSQDNATPNFQRHKHAVDSLINNYAKLNLSKSAIVGTDENLKTYKGNVLTNQPGIIKSIELNFDSSSANAVKLFCLNDSIVAVTENEHFFYQIKDSFYTNNGDKITSPQMIKRFEAYAKILAASQRIFKPD